MRNEELERENMNLQEKSFLSGRNNPNDDSSFLQIGPSKEISLQIDALNEEKHKLQ